ncbi:9809_t:CDS:2 [Paraglomus occultum]|uniref:Arginine N-methyltransferase 2 n=1 Tax=Paraglomus occultum TaxID=144539 RepID=A0A9N8VQY0_9GLOM|nr:9809_t:CDS:2 [Paraglomus occultum]
MDNTERETIASGEALSLQQDLSNLLLQATKDANKELIKQLLSQGADFSARGEEGATSLHLACAAGNSEIVSLLLQYGHPWNAIDNNRKTAGEYAKECGHEQVYEQLLAEGCRVELILGVLERRNRNKDDPSNLDFLTKPLKYSDDGERLLDSENNGVMMGWEKPLMERHVQVICTDEGLDILNVGFGLGLIDSYIQSYKPRSHTIIEAHPDVYAHMLANGWDKKPGVKIIFGRWQDVLDQLELYDGIFFDTFGEFYADIHDFHEELLNMLKPEGVYSFFNGLGATNPFFHDVYCRIAEMHLASIGLSTEYVEIKIDPSEDKIWEGVKARYWTLDTYRLPICRITLQ